MIYAIRAHSLHLSGEALVHYGFVILYPLGNVALYGSIYLTLAVSIERFLGKFWHFLGTFLRLLGVNFGAFLGTFFGPLWMGVHSAFTVVLKV
jgi:hypothetical protein